jgi:hypothetical protein
VEDHPQDEPARVEVPGADGWRYLPFQEEDDGMALTVTAVRDEDGAEVSFTVPAIVSRGAELGEVARVVIGAHERVERSEGLGA